MEFNTFYREFELASSESEKRDILNNYLSENDLDEDEINELILQIQDFTENELDEVDALINLEIEEGLYSLFTCIKSIGDYKSGSNYYVKEYDTRDFYLETGIGDTDPRIDQMVRSIKPTYWIVTDSGIGTRKSKLVFPNDLEFKDYFTKFA